ncbi:MAG TPA: hypothetical protein VK665_06515 [Candidatus Elarobacter sp.]|nr:hypothetical protein [Candidatus Elarobacter sp.]
MDSNYEVATSAERERRYREVRRITSGIVPIRPGAIETASVLLAETKSSFDRIVAGSANIESKATVFLGIVAGTASALGLFAAHGDRAQLARPVLPIAMALVVIALVSLLCVLRAKWFPSPNLGPYVSAAMVQEDNRIGVSFVLAEYYGEMRARLHAENRRDARFLLTAYTATAIAAFVLLLDAAATSRWDAPGTQSRQARQLRTAAPHSPKRTNFVSNSGVRTDSHVAGGSP